MYGWPLLVHYCDVCHYNTTVTYSATVWIEFHTCSFCGTSSPGVDIAGHSVAQMNQYQHDELARLFTQNMQLSQANQEQIQQTRQPALVEPVLHESEKQNGQQQPVPFISTHYTGTAYVRPDTTSEPSRSPPPPYHEALMPEAMYETLRQHSIDPSALLPNQIHLFQNADHEQRLRLLELWRIAPPRYPLEEHMNGTWTSTSVEREEALARVRYEQQQLESRGYQEEHMLDTHIPREYMQTRTPEEPISPIREAGEAAWPPAARMRVSSIANSRPETRQGMAEPYIVSGYTEDGAGRAIDPVYAAAVDLWQAPTYAQAVQNHAMLADQYGMYEQIRNHADWERLNEQIAREKLAQEQAQAQAQAHVPLEDCEMEL